MERLAPLEYSPEGKPRVLVPDEVFHRGENLNKEFIVGSFLGKMPDYRPIQSVLNYMWGKGKRVEIHLNPLKRSMLIRVPNDYIRKKILEKKLWYVGTSMFYVSQWNSTIATATPEIVSIPLWAHITGIPLDLRSREGLSLAAGLVGEPKETDQYTKNLTNLNVAHVKVEVNLQKPLPSEVELIRQNGEIIPLQVDYPWTPPSCSHCKEIGHIFRNCINISSDLKPPTSETTTNTTSTVKAPTEAVYSPQEDTITTVVEEAAVEEAAVEEVETHASDASVDASVKIPGHGSIYASDFVPSSEIPPSISVVIPPPFHISPKSQSQKNQLSPKPQNPRNPPSPQSQRKYTPPSPVQNTQSPDQLLPFLTHTTQASEASFVIALPATMPPTFGSYITTKNAFSLLDPSPPPLTPLSTKSVCPPQQISPPNSPSYSKKPPFALNIDPIPPFVIPPAYDKQTPSLESDLLVQGETPNL